MSVEAEKDRPVWRTGRSGMHQPLEMPHPSTAVPSEAQLAAELQHAVWRFGGEQFDHVRIRIGADRWPNRLANIGIARIIKPGAGLYKLTSAPLLFTFHPSLFKAGTGGQPRPKADEGWAVIVPVFSADDELIDLVAWPIGKRGYRFYRRTGAGLHLGNRWIAYARRTGRALPMHRNVLEWLRNCGRGCTPLTDDVSQLRGLLLEYSTGVPHSHPKQGLAWDQQFAQQIAALLAKPDPVKRTTNPQSAINCAKARANRLQQYRDRRAAMACETCGQLKQGE
jgi:hypothetical protein